MRLFAAAFCALALSSAAHAGTVSIDFNDLPIVGYADIVPIGDFYNGAGGPALGLTTTGFIGNSFGAFTTQNEFFYGGGYLKTTFAFNAVSFDIMGIDVIDIGVYTGPGVNGQFTAGQSLGATFTPIHVNLVASSQSHYVAFDSENAEAFSIDNLVFTTPGGRNGQIAPGIPEPGAWSLLILGFGVVGAAMRRRATSGEAQVFPV